MNATLCEKQAPVLKGTRLARKSRRKHDLGLKNQVHWLAHRQKLHLYLQQPDNEQSWIVISFRRDQPLLPKYKQGCNHRVS
eukprot:1146135-Pelagomonas_calceolata.AAC.16